MSRCRLLHPGWIPLLLVGCAGIPGPDASDAAHHYRQQALALEARGEQADALFQWRVVAALAPHDRTASQHVRRLSAERAQAATALRDRGLASLKRGQRRKARQELYRAWVLSPRDPLTLAALRDLERHRLERQVRAKVARSRQALGMSGSGSRPSSDEPEQAGERDYLANELATRPDPSPVPSPLPKRSKAPQSLPVGSSRARVQALLARAETLFARQRHDAGLALLARADRIAASDPGLSDRLRARRRAFADRLYNAGVQRAAEAPQQALALWRQALAYYPDHARAALRIRRLADTATRGGVTPPSP